MAATLIGLGSLYLDKRDPVQSGLFLERAEKELKDLDDPYEVLRLYAYRSELGIFEMRQSQEPKPRPEVLDYLEKGVKSARDLQTKYGEAVFYMILGEYYGLIAEFKQSDENFERAIEIFGRINYKKMLGETHLEYGRMLKHGIQQGAYPAGAADVQFDKAAAVFKDINLEHRIQVVENYRNA